MSKKHGHARGSRTRGPRSIHRHDTPAAITALIAPAFAGVAARGRWCPVCLSLCAILMALSDAATITDRFGFARAAVNARRGERHRRRVGRSYTGLVRVLLVGGVIWAEVLTTHLRKQHGPPLNPHRDPRLNPHLNPHLKRFGLLAFAADGTHFDCPHTAANVKGFGRFGKREGVPQLSMLTLWHMGTGLPFAWAIGKATQPEREQLRSLIPILPEGAVIVADAGFTGYELLSSLRAGGADFLIRVGSGTHLLTKLGYDVKEEGSTVYLWPKGCGGPPLTLRLVRVHRPGKPDVCLLTSITDHERLSDVNAAALYRMRWGVELFFRDLKRTLLRHTMRSAAPAQARAELQWTMIALTALGLLAARALIERGRDPLSLSMALALRAARSCVGAGTPPARFDRALAAAVKDARPRFAAKARREWARKGKRTPCGEPRLHPASPQQISEAQAFLAQEGKE